MLDINVLIYAHRTDASLEHAAYANWLEEIARGQEPYAVTQAVLAGLVRIVTNRPIFPDPSTHDQVFGFVHELIDRPNAQVFAPGPRHMEIFESLCRQTGAQGKLVGDAHYAAGAIEYGCTWITTDSDFSRFPGLRWSHPLRPSA
jgi:hypothetical protein